MNTFIDNAYDVKRLREAWYEVQQLKPGIRIREAAKELGTSEAQLLATKTGHGVTKLRASWQVAYKK